MTSLRLVRPTTELEASYKSLVAEFVERGEELVPWVLAEPVDEFEAYVDRFNNYALGIDLPPGFVPASLFWLVDASNEIVAVAHMRHKLNDELRKFGGHVGYGVRPSARRRGYATELLRLCLLELRKLGVDEVLVTCDKDNIASIRTIMNNGGVLEDEEFMQEHGCIIQRYWIR